MPLAARRLELVPGCACFVYGHGSRVFVTLHGWSGDHRVYEPLASLMGADSDVTMVVFDQPGSGESAPPSPWSLDPFVAPMLTSLSALDLGPLTLAGNCAGAVIALEMALRLEGQAQRLVLIDPFAYVPWYFRVLTLPFVGRFFYQVTFGNALGRRLTDVALKDRRGAHTSLTRGFITAPHDHAHAHLSLLCRLRDVGRYRALSAPTDVVYGGRTFAAVKRSVAMLRSILPQGQTVMLPDTGHLPIQEATVGVANVLFGEPASLKEQHLPKRRALLDGTCGPGGMGGRDDTSCRGGTGGIAMH